MISKRKTAERPLVMEFPSAVDISVGESKTKNKGKRNAYLNLPSLLRNSDGSYCTQSIADKMYQN